MTDNTTRIRFGEFVLDRASRELTRNGAPVHLSPKAMQLLEVLIAERPRAVSKDELLDRVWPGTIVEEENVKNLVGEIRRVLADQGREPRFIRTVHRFGYSFCGVAEELSDQSRPEAKYLLVSADRRFPLMGEMVIGRDPACGVWIPVEGISRRHARITVTADAVKVEDLRSKNGTWVRGQRIKEPTEVLPGDEIVVGPERFLLTSVTWDSVTKTMERALVPKPKQ